MTAEERADAEEGAEVDRLFAERNAEARNAQAWRSLELAHRAVMRDRAEATA